MREIFDVFDKAESIKVYSSGDVKSYKSGSQEYKGILTHWSAMIEDAYEMPAFGVSLHNETIEVMKSGRWVEFEFGSKLKYNGMSFEKLLIQVVGDYQGFNLIRYNAEKGYEGRCFFFNLVDKDMGKLSEYLAFLDTNTAK